MAPSCLAWWLKSTNCSASVLTTWSVRWSSASHPGARAAMAAVATAVAAVPAAWAQAQNSIRSITTTTEGGNDVVRVELDKPLTELPKGFSIQSPARIALDFAGVGNSTGRTSLELNQGNIKSANVVEAGDRTRVVLNLGQAAGMAAARGLPVIP